MKKLGAAVLVLVLVIVSGASVFALEFRYDELTGAKAARVDFSVAWNPERSACELSLEDASANSWSLGLDGAYATTRCAISYADGRALSLDRDGNVIRLRGSAEGRELRENLTIDACPWFESMEFCLGGFALGSGKRIDFWIVDPDKKKAHKMTAERMGFETLGGAGSAGKAIKVRVRAFGVPAMFYGIVFWYRPSDGVLLRFEGLRGGPGQPKTILELRGEK